MRSIIAAAALVVLTACGGPPDGGLDDATRDAAARASRADARGAADTDRAATGRDESAAEDDDRDAARNGGAARRNVVFVGTSLTAGYGVGHEVAFPALIQQKVDSAGLPYRVINAGISGETSAAGLRRIDWVLQQPVDVLVLELGANDGLRGIDPDLMRRNLDAILERTRDVYPQAAVVLVGMEAPPNLGDAYTSRFRRVFTELAGKYDATLVPFLLEGVAAERTLNIADGIHPNPEGHRILAATVWRMLGPVLERRTAAALDEAA